MCGCTRRRDRFDLAQKPVAADRGCDVRLHDFDGDRPAMAGVSGEEDHRHAAFAEQIPGRDTVRSAGLEPGDTPPLYAARANRPSTQSGPALVFVTVPGIHEAAMATALQSPPVQQIADDDAHPVLRNLRITLAYYDLSQRLAARTGGEFINWCSMACWSSKSVGTYIRSEELPAELRNGPHGTSRPRRTGQRCGARRGDPRPGR